MCLPNHSFYIMGVSHLHALLKITTLVALLSIQFSDLPISFGTSCNCGMYFTTLDLLCTKREGFSLKYRTAIPEAFLRRQG